MTDGKKLTDAALGLGGIALDLATQNYAGAALQGLALAKDFASAAMEQRFGRWWMGICESDVWETAQEVQGLIEARLKESAEAKEAVWASAKAILDSVSDESAQVIGSITAEYIKAKQAPDSLLRGFTRVLADLSTEELDLLRAVISEALSHSTPRVSFEVGDTGNVKFKAVGQKEPWIILPFDEPELIRRIFRLLKSNDLGWDTPTGGFVGRGGPGNIWLDSTILQWMGGHLGVLSAQSNTKS